MLELTKLVAQRLAAVFEAQAGLFDIEDGCFRLAEFVVQPVGLRDAMLPPMSRSLAPGRGDNGGG